MQLYINIKQKKHMCTSDILLWERSIKKSSIRVFLRTWCTCNELFPHAISHPHNVLTIFWLGAQIRSQKFDCFKNWMKDNANIGPFPARVEKTLNREAVIEKLRAPQKYERSRTEDSDQGAELSRLSTSVMTPGKTSNDPTWGHDPLVKNPWSKGLTFCFVITLLFKSI